MSHDRPTEPLPALDDTAVTLHAPDGYAYEVVVRPGRQPTRRRLAILLVAVVVGVIGVGITWWGRSHSVSRPDASPTGAVVVPVSVTSLDPVGGSGFARTSTSGSSSWHTQTYRTATFGNLKDGVGLVLDLGAPRALSVVIVDAQPGPLTIELRSADQRPAAANARGLTVVGSPVMAQGPTTLAASTGGTHRYWIVWVSRLAAADGGFSATLSQPVARA